MPTNLRTKLVNTLKWLSHSGIIISCSAAGIAYTVSVAYGVITPNIALLVSIFLIFWAVYRVNKILDLEEDKLNHPERVKHIHKGKTKIDLWTPPVLAYCLALVLTFITSVWAFAVVILSFFWIACYSLKLPNLISKNLHFERIKEVPVLKNVYSCVAWGMIVLISAFMLDRNIGIITWVLFIFVFMRTLITTISFDIRDIKGDKALGINTIPVLIGFRKTTQLLLLLNILAGVLLLFSIYFNALPISMLFLILTSLYGYYFITALSGKMDINFLCDVILDGEYIIWIPLSLLGVFLL